jgi:hypothetical protein
MTYSGKLTTSGRILVWNGTRFVEKAAAGDLSGSYFTGPTVAKVNGSSVPAGGSLTTGNVLQVTGSAALGYAALNLAGGSNYVTGTLPNTNLPAATTGAAGIVQLTNNLGGTSTSPTVTGLTITSQAQGDILYYNGSSWVRLAASTDGYFLKTGGAGANPSWTKPTATDLSITSQAQGDILYYNGTNWVRLAAGTSGQYLKTRGAGQNPAWANASDLIITSQAQGDLLYYSGSAWTRLAAGTAGAPLITGGTGANPYFSGAIYGAWRAPNGSDSSGNMLTYWTFGQTLGNSAPGQGGNYGLVVDTGTQRWTQIAPGLTGFVFDGYTILYTNSILSSFHAAEEFTFDCIMTIARPQDQNAIVFANRALANGAATSNILAQVQIDAHLYCAPPHWIHQQGSNVTKDFNPTWAALPIGRPFHLCYTRSTASGGNVTMSLYVDGEQLYTDSTINAASKNGSGDLQQMCLGGAFDLNSNFFAGIISCARTFNVERTPSQVLTTANYVRGIG